MFNPEDRFKENITAQELFDHAVYYFASMTARSIDGDQCMYRHPNGCQCAAGYFLKDSEYERAMEGTRIGVLILPERLQQHSMLLHFFQQFHDSKENWKVDNKIVVRTKLKWLADRHDLKADSIDLHTWVPLTQSS